MKVIFNQPFFVKGSRMKKLIGVILLATGLSSTAVFAELPAWYPSDYTNFDSYGMVAEISSSSIVIDGQAFIISPTAKVSTAVANATGNLKEIESGKMVGVNIIDINNRKLVDHIWLIPEDEMFKIP